MEDLTIDKNDGNGEMLKKYIESQPINSLISVNGKKFAYTDKQNINSLIT